jgi:hypothetical protein
VFVDSSSKRCTTLVPSQHETRKASTSTRAERGCGCQWYLYNNLRMYNANEEPKCVDIWRYKTMKTEPRNISSHFTSHQANTETASRPRVSAPPSGTDASLICRYPTPQKTRQGVPIFLRCLEPLQHARHVTYSPCSVVCG